MEGVFMIDKEVIEKVKNTLISSGTTFSDDKKRAYIRAIEKEDNENSKWVLETILENADAAEKNKSPLCDDTGIPHIVLEVGSKTPVTAGLLGSIRQGVEEGLRELPGRPMGVLGDDCQRISQALGLDEDPAGVLPAPILIKESEGEKTLLHVMMFGGGPAIRGKTHRIFHKHSVETVLEEIVQWAKEAVSLLGCTPCTLAIGVGRSQFEASSMMMEALVEGNYDIQSDMEKEITDRVNESNVGPLGLCGNTSVLATFMKVGPQRASGVRVVCIRPCCCFEPRIATCEL